MTLLSSALDRRRRGTHYSDRLQRILGACQDCGLLWHEERIPTRNGRTETRRFDNIAPAGSVVVTSRYEKYGLRVNPRVLRRVLKMSEQFAYALNVPSASVEVDGNIVFVRVPRFADGRHALVTFQEAWSIAPTLPLGHLLLGVDDEHRQLITDLTSPANVHAAVIGMTGSGKSTLMRTMILSALMQGGVRVALFDLSAGYQTLCGHPSVWRGGLFRLAEECEAGLSALVRRLKNPGGHGPTFVFVDEVPELIAQSPRVKDHLTRLAQAGRHAGIHLILGAQHPLSSVLGPTTLRNVAVRLVGRVADRSAAYNATGRNDSGAEKLCGQGDFVAVNGPTLQHFQAAMISGSFLEEWRQQYPPRPARVPVYAGRHPKRAATSMRSATLRGSGCALDDISPDIVDEIHAYTARHGREPSSNWIYGRTRNLLPTGGYGREKAQRALDAARARSGQQKTASETG